MGLFGAGAATEAGGKAAQGRRLNKGPSPHALAGFRDPRNAW
jgi:hypothetical protein